MAKLDDVNWNKDQDGSIPNSADNIDKVKTLLNTTGSGFCLAKFTQVTMHLGTGKTHACHHPSPHKIPLEELNNNPAALFNTKHLKNARKEMIEGKKPSECDYCWRVEDSNGLSDRYFKSIEPWALEKHDEIVNSNPEDDFYPSYLEVDFSNVCNYKCTYCGPEFSSKWVEELKQNGPIKVLENTKDEQWIQGWQDLDNISYKNRDFNPYVDAFWKWFPEAYKHLKVYRITGGEPLLSKETFKSMDWLMQNPNPDLEFNINTNLGAPENLWREFIEKAKALAAGNFVKKFTIFTSVDGFGKRAEYARVGLNFDSFTRRYEQLLQIPNIRAVIMVTFNIFSVTSIKELLEWHLSLKKKYNPSAASATWEIETGYKFNDTGDNFKNRKAAIASHTVPVGIDIPYLRWPNCLDAQYITPELVQNYLIPAMNFMAENSGNPIWVNHQGFEAYEIEKLKRICIQTMYRVKNDTAVPDNDTIINRAKFYDYVNELDKRYGSKFVEVFPEMESFYEICKVTKSNL